MKERRTPLLQNMCGPSRTTVSISPSRYIGSQNYRAPEPPRPETTDAQGAMVASKSWVVLNPKHLGIEQKTIRSLLEKLFGEKTQLADEFVEQRLRELLELEIQTFGLKGCVIVEEKAPDPNEKSVRVVYAKQSRVALAILAKSTGKLFVASKTPNFSPSVLSRSLYTCDRRIVEICLRAELWR